MFAFKLLRTYLFKDSDVCSEGRRLQLVPLAKIWRGPLWSSVSSFLGRSRCVRRLKRVRVWKMARFVEPETLLAWEEGREVRRKEDGSRAWKYSLCASRYIPFLTLNLPSSYLSSRYKILIVRYTQLTHIYEWYITVPLLRPLWQCRPWHSMKNWCIEPILMCLCSVEWSADVFLLAGCGCLNNLRDVHKMSVSLLAAQSKSWQWYTLLKRVPWLERVSYWCSRAK